jgi:tRNA pseudouridine65 synthase
MIIEQSKDWLIINKPAGISVHNEEGDVLSLLRKQLAPGSFQDIYPVHRLDKETSGLMVVALNPKTATALAEQFQAHATEKLYCAVLRGTLPLSNTWLEWATPISDKAEGRKNPQGLSADRVEAKSLYRVLKSNQYFSLVEVKILTGRQHQIRKHAVLAKHPVVGDARYGDPKDNERIAKLYGTNRMFLHAFRLSLLIEGQVRTFEAPLTSEFSSLGL